MLRKLITLFLEEKKKLSKSFSLSFGNQILKQVSETKFLGVYVDENFTWKPHISFVCKQISKSVGIIFRSRYCLSSNTKLTLYYTLIYPYITYCNSAWSSTYVTNLNGIFLFTQTGSAIC